RGRGGPRGADPPALTRRMPGQPASRAGPSGPARPLGWEIVLLLALDTATPAVTVALYDGNQIVAERTTVDARRQGELLAAAIQAVLGAGGATVRDLTVIAAGVGPGPYTGLRAGLVTARVLGSSLGIPAHGVCSLDVIAAGAVAGGVLAGR